MSDFNYDSYCGIYCGACDIMMSCKTGNKYKLASFWNEATVKSLHKGLGLKYDDNQPFKTECRGCKSDMQFINCRVCKIRECAINRGIEHCIDCDKYPCDQISGMKKNEIILPHIKDNHSNMITIKEFGTNQWLSEQSTKWKCPDCGMDYAWYSSKCFTCGKDLRKHAHKLTFFHLLLLKIGIYLLSHRKTSKVNL